MEDDTPDFYPDNGSLFLLQTSMKGSGNALVSDVFVPFRDADFALVPILLVRQAQWVGELDDFPGFSGDWQAVGIVEGYPLASREGEHLMATQWRFMWPWIPPRADTWRRFVIYFGAEGDIPDKYEGGGESSPPLGYSPTNYESWFPGPTGFKLPPGTDGVTRLRFSPGPWGYEWLAQPGVVVATTRAAGMIPGMYANNWDLYGLVVQEGVIPL